MVELALLFRILRSADHVLNAFRALVAAPVALASFVFNLIHLAPHEGMRAPGSTGETQPTLLGRLEDRAPASAVRCDGFSSPWR